MGVGGPALASSLVPPYAETALKLFVNWTLRGYADAAAKLAAAT